MLLFDTDDRLKYVFFAKLPVILVQLFRVKSTIMRFAYFPCLLETLQRPRAHKTASPH